MACACACAHACRKGCCISNESLMSITAVMSIRSTQHNHSSKTINTATTTRSMSPMNRGVRVGVASTTDEPKKHPRHNNMTYYLLPTTYYLLPTILLLINTYNLRPVKSLFSTDRYAYAKRSLFRPWEPQPPDSSSDCGAVKSGKAGASERPGIGALRFPGHPPVRKLVLSGGRNFV